MRMGLGFVAATLAFAALGCGKKTAECNAIIEVINKGTTANNANKMDDAAGLKKAGETYQGVASSLAKVELTVPELQKISTSMQKSCNDLGAATHKLVGSEDKEAMDAAVAAVKASSDSYDKDVEELKKFCGAS
jgi:hypothetical protein